MKNFFKIFLITSILFSVIAAPARAEDLENFQPLILPTNPFYFLKEWKRGVLKIFTFSRFKKIELDLEIADEKIAELKKLEEITDANPKALNKAADNYQKNLETLGERIVNLREIRQNPQLVAVLDETVSQGIRHIELLSGLKQKVNSDKSWQKLEDLQKKISEIIVQTGIADLESRLRKALIKQKNSLTKEIQAAEAVDYLETELPSGQKDILMTFKEDLLLKFQSRITGKNSDDLRKIWEQLITNSVEKIKILDELREGISDNDLKNFLNIIRQEILEMATEQKEIRKLEADETIKKAEGIIKELKKVKTEVNFKSVFAESLLSKAVFNLDQAKSALESRNYGEAFNQGSSALAAARTALNQLLRFAEDKKYNAVPELKNQKELYDSLTLESKEVELNDEDKSKLSEIFDKGEKLLVQIADLINKKAKIEAVAPLLKESKILLFRIEDILNPL